MFGCNPRLLVDFLQGVGEDASENPSVEEWIQGHQEGLKVAYEQVRQRIEARVEKRNKKCNEQVNDTGLEEGQLVKGRHKIQDTWDSCVYQVVRCPLGQGVVYSVRPAYVDGPVRQVHTVGLS